MRSGSKPSRSDIKGRLADFDRQGLIGLVQDLYGASKDNQAFLHARFALGDDVLKPYKATIDRWLWPDVFKNQDTSALMARLDFVRRISHNFGYGVGDDMDVLLSEHGLDDQ